MSTNKCQYISQRIFLPPGVVPFKKTQKKNDVKTNSNGNGKKVDILL